MASKWPIRILGDQYRSLHLEICWHLSNTERNTTYRRRRPAPNLSDFMYIKSFGRIRGRMDPRRHWGKNRPQTIWLCLGFVHYLLFARYICSIPGCLAWTLKVTLCELFYWTLLITKLIDLGLRRSLIPWICNFLSGRKLNVLYSGSRFPNGQPRTLASLKELNWDQFYF